jgi:two-component system nitrate/nitrite response regulator NarL
MKVLLLDDHALFRAGLRLLLGTLDREATVLEAGTINEAIALADQHPDLELCLLDLNLRHENGLMALGRIKTAAPEVAVVIVSSSDDEALVRTCLDAGAMSFIAKSSAPEVLSEALWHVLAGAVYLPPRMLDIEDNSGKQAVALSSRQRDVLRGLCRGLSTKSIAHDLSLSDHTVKEYIAAIFQLLSVHNRTEAVIKASQMQLLLDTH